MNNFVYHGMQAYLCFIKAAFSVLSLTNENGRESSPY